MRSLLAVRLVRLVLVHAFVGSIGHTLQHATGEAAEAPLPVPPALVEWKWNGTAFPKCVINCATVVDGPMAANGDVGE